MDIEIGEVVSSVRAVDGSAPLSPEVMQQIVRAVLQAVEDKMAHEGRVHAERRITAGVSQERDEEE